MIFLKVLSQVILFIQNTKKKIQITSNNKKTVLRIKHDHFKDHLSVLEYYLRNYRPQPDISR